MRFKRRSANVEKLSENVDDRNQLLISTISSEAEILSTIYCLRPVSNLKFVSKLTEMAACNQEHSHVSANNLYLSLQSSYRKGHSTETALLKIVNDILLNMNKQHVTLLVLLDLSAAFDTVDHDILIQRLTTKFGINGVVLNWFKSYLEGRSQHVSVQGSVSEKFDLKWGVPQGFCLGPLLFILYASELFNVLEAHLPSVHCYADDTQLYLSFRPNDNHGEDDALKAMELCVQDIRVWLSRDKLFMNDKKTEFLVIGTRQQLKKVSIGCLTIGAEKMLVAEKPVKNLGVLLRRAQQHSIIFITLDVSDATYPRNLRSH